MYPNTVNTICTTLLWDGSWKANKSITLQQARSTLDTAKHYHLSQPGRNQAFIEALRTAGSAQKCF